MGSKKNRNKGSECVCRTCRCFVTDFGLVVGVSRMDNFCFRKTCAINPNRSRPECPAHSDIKPLTETEEKILKGFAERKERFLKMQEHFRQVRARVHEKAEQAKTRKEAASHEESKTEQTTT